MQSSIWIKSAIIGISISLVALLGLIFIARYLLANEYSQASTEIVDPTAIIEEQQYTADESEAVAVSEPEETSPELTSDLDTLTSVRHRGLGIAFWYPSSAWGALSEWEEKSFDDSDCITGQTADDPCNVLNLSIENEFVDRTKATILGAYGTRFTQFGSGGRGAYYVDTTRVITDASVIENWCENDHDFVDGASVESCEVYTNSHNVRVAKSVHQPGQPGALYYLAQYYYIYTGNTAYPAIALSTERMYNAESSEEHVRIVNEQFDQLVDSIVLE